MWSQSITTVLLSVFMANNIVVIVISLFGLTNIFKVWSKRKKQSELKYVRM